MRTLTLSLVKLLTIYILIALVVACTPSAESPGTPTQAEIPTETSTPTPPPLPTTTATDAAVAAPIDVTSTEPATEGPVTPTSTVPLPVPGPLPVEEMLQFTIQDHLGGLPTALDVEGSTVYISFGPRLLALDMSDPSNPQLLGQSDLLPGQVWGIDIVDGRAYLAAAQAGLVVLDVGDPAIPTILNDGPNYAGANQPSAVAVTVAGDNAYLVDLNRQDGKSTLLRFDIANPAQPTLISSHELQPNDRVVVDDELIVVAGNGRLQFRETANPDRILGQTNLEGASYASIAAVYEDVVTVAISGEKTGILQFDITDPGNAVPLSGLVESELFFLGQAETNGQLFVLGGTFGEFGYCGSQISIADVSGDRPVPAITMDPENCINDMTLRDNLLFVAGRSGLQAYDVGDPANPALLSHFTHPAGFHDAQGVAIHQGTTYVLTAEGRSFDVVHYDLAQAGSAPQRLEIGARTLLDLFVDGNTLIIPEWMGGLNTVDISDPAAPVLIHQPAEGELFSGDLFAMALGDGVAYMQVLGGTWVGAVGAIDISDPADPHLAGVIETGQSQVMSLALASDRLYVLSQGEASQVHIYDVSQKLEPVLLGMVPMQEYVSRLAIVGDRLYASCDKWNCSSLYAIDVGDPADPRIVVKWPLPFGVQDMVVGDQGLIYMITLDEGIWVLDASDPNNVRLAGRGQLPGSYVRLKVIDSQIYAAAYDAGLYVIQVDR